MGREKRAACEADALYFRNKQLQKKAGSFTINMIIILVIIKCRSRQRCGSIGFVGLIVPHLTRKLVGVDYRWIIPCSAVLGSLLVVFADLAARMVHPPYETPLGALIALLGVPFFLYLARKERREL